MPAAGQGSGPAASPATASCPALDPLRPGADGISDDNADDSRAFLHPQLHHTRTSIVPGHVVRPCLRIRTSIGSKEAADRSIRRGTRHH
jgi:hypothetical protein